MHTAFSSKTLKAN